MIEDHVIVSQGLSSLISNQMGLRICGIAQDYASAIAMTASLDPDLIISEIALNDCDGLELIKDIKAHRPKQRVLILSVQEESLYAPRALRAGALGYVMKHEAIETLLAAIHRVLDGEVYLSPFMEKQMMQRLFKHKPNPLLDPLECLSNRELAVLRLIGQAKTTREIATELQLSAKTIDSHRHNVRKKLELKEGRDLVWHALHLEREQRGVECM